MASKRQRGEAWEFVVKKAKVLDAPLYFTFKSEAEGDEYCRKLEALLDRGIVPTEYQPNSPVQTISNLISKYERESGGLKPKDRAVLQTVDKVVGSAGLAGLDANWVDGWVTDMKRIDKYAPATIRSKVGALARCMDWGVRKKLLILPDHPFRSLPEGYASYTKEDEALAGGGREDVERGRRLEGDEEERIRRVIMAGVLPRKQRSRLIEHVAGTMAFFDVAVETAMRMSEIYTLTREQVLLAKRTVVLTKTKNGDARSVPMSSVALSVFSEQLSRHSTLK